MSENEWFAHFFNTKLYIKFTKKDFRFFSQIFLSESLIPSFSLSNLKQLLMVPHLPWATWAIRALSLISSEQPEPFAQGRSFVLSNLSKSLTVAHLIWTKWANEWMSNERMSEWAMSEWANSQPWFTVNIVHIKYTVFSWIVGVT